MQVVVLDKFQDQRELVSSLRALTFYLIVFMF